MGRRFTPRRAALREASDFFPAVTRDGKRVAFALSPTGVTADLSEIWVAPADLSARARRIRSAPGRMLYEPTWSPDGRSIAYVVGYPAGFFGVGYQAQLWVMGAGHKHSRLIASTPGAIEQPEWSPQGDRIAFVVDKQASGAFVDVVAVDRLVPRPQAVTPVGMVGLAWPHWSPSGDRLAFETAEGLYTVRPDGDELRRIADGTNYFFSGGAVWSPDGRALALCNSQGGYFFGGVHGYGPLVVNADGTQQRWLGTDACLWPQWSPDGHEVAAISPHGSTWELTIYDDDGSVPRTLGPGGHWLNWRPV